MEDMGNYGYTLFRAIPLVKFVNALAMVSGTTDYDALAKFLNEHIDRYKHEVLPKKKKGGKKPSEGEKKPGDGGKTPDGKKPGGDAAKPGDGGDGKDKPGGGKDQPGGGKDKPGGKGQGDATITPEK